MEKRKRHTTAIILAAGNSSRMGENVRKQQLNLLGESVLYRSVKSFSLSEKIDSIVVVTRADEIDWVTAELASFSKVCAIITGGKTRAESAKIGFSAIPESTNIVAIHDGARCLVTPDKIDAVVDAATEHGAATAGTYVTDTVKQLKDGKIVKTLSRDKLFFAHTPQVFSRELYERAISCADPNESMTDDNMFVEQLGSVIFPVDTGKENIKITTRDDISYAERILERRERMSEIRIGHGYDVHRLCEGRRLVLGGVEIPYTKGLLGHSDADVLVHAIMDAILGACGLGDIGRHFPDSDERYKGISSLILLRKVCNLIQNHGFEVVNIDATIVMQSPKIAGYIDTMISNIAEILGVEQGRVNVKATTEERLGFSGREEGVSAHAVASVKK